MMDSKLRSLCEAIIDEGLGVFDLNLGLVSKIDQDSYLILAVMPKFGVFRANEAFDLKDTYCREVVSKGQTIALTELGDVRGLCKHPLYAGLPLESYISAPIKVGGSVWGTLNFSSMKIKECDFSNKEIELIESRADSIAEYINSYS